MLRHIAQEIVAKAANSGGIANIFLVGCGGSLGALYPAKAFIETEAANIKCIHINSNEFVHTPQKELGARSVVITVSHQGNTPETVEATKMASKAGAQVVTFTYKEGDSPLSLAGDYVVRYAWGDGHDISKEKTMLVLRLVVELVHLSEGYIHYDAFNEATEKIHSITSRAMEASMDKAAAFAQEYKDDTFIYVMGSGASFGAAYMESICIFMEMQWINSAAIHTGEYFHGPFEVTDPDRAFIIQINAGKTRALDLRALKFLNTYAKRFVVLDAEELGLNVLNENVVDYFAHSFFTNLYTVYNKALAEARNHPLSTRRYMWKVPY